MHTNQRPVCGSCGGTRIEVDAWAVWDLEAKAWVLGSSDEAEAVCHDCNRKTFVEWRPLPKGSPPDPSEALGGPALTARAERDLPAPRSRAEAINAIYGAARPYEGQRYARLPAADRTKILLTWSRCASLLEAPARPIVKHGIVDLSWYRATSSAAA